MGKLNDVKSNIHKLDKVKGFKLVHMNIRSLPKNIDQLRIILHNSSVDVFKLSETWLKGSLNSKLYSVKGFNIYRLDRATNGRNKKRGGGLVTYIHSRHASVTASLDELSTTIDLEAQWLKICRMLSLVICIGPRVAT